MAAIATRSLKRGRRLPCPSDRSPIGLGVTGLLVAAEVIHSLRRRASDCRPLLAELSSAFARASPSVLDDRLDDALERVGRVFAVERAGILRWTKDEASMSFTHRWSAGRAPPLPPPIIPIAFPAVAQRLEKGKTIAIPRLDALPAGAVLDRVTYARLGDTSMVFVPMVPDDPILATLWLGCDGWERRWTKADVRQLEEVASVMAVALRWRSSVADRNVVEVATADILDCLSAQVAILDARGTIVRCNDAWRRFADRCVSIRSGLDVGADYVETWRAMARDDGGMACPVLLRIEAALSGDHTAGAIEYVCHAPDGDQTFEIEVMPLRGPRGGAVVAQHDETSRKRAELEVQQRRRDAAHFARVTTISGLAASLAHELSQPLTAIRSNAQTAQHYVERLPHGTDDMRSVLADIVSDVDRAGGIIDRVRGLLRNRPLTTSAIDLNDLVRDVIKLLASDATLRRATLVPALDPALVTVQADRIQIQQVVLNLILNALEAIDRAGRRERRVTAITHQYEQQHVRLSVRDTGPGLGNSPDDWFEPFHSSKEHGLGLGLSISRMIVEAHGGSLEAENNDSGGATFHVLLPTTAGIVP